MKYVVIAFIYKESPVTKKEFWGTVKKYIIVEDGISTPVVEFPVNEWDKAMEIDKIFDRATQHRRAKALCDFMNRMERHMDSLELKVEV